MAQGTEHEWRSISTKKTCRRTSLSPTGRSPSIPRRWACIRAATGCAWCSCPTARATSISSASRADSDYAAPNLKALLGDPDRLKLYHFARFDVGDHAGLSRDHGRAALLHADGLAPGAHLHRPARPQGTGQGTARTSTFRSSSRPATGARRRSTTRSANMPPATSATFMR